MYVFYNDKYLYSGGDVVNNARHYHNIVRAEGLAPHVTKEEYCNENPQLTQYQLESHDQKTQLKGQMGWQCMALNRGEKVNQRGVELYQKMSGFTDLDYTQRAWIEVVRVAEIDVVGDGDTIVYWA